MSRMKDDGGDEFNFAELAPPPPEDPEPELDLKELDLEESEELDQGPLAKVIELNSFEAWRTKLLHGSKGHILANAANAAIFLQWRPELKGLFYWDDLAEQPVLTRDPPFEHQSIKKGFAVNSQAVSRFGAYLMEEESIYFPQPMLHEAIQMVAYEHRECPIQKYLGGLKWDMRRRLEHFGPKYLGMEENGPEDVFAVFIKKWLIGAVARVLRPGCQVDNMLVLEGKQGVGKTSALKALVPIESWYKEGKIDVINKDGEIANRFCWIREIGELSGLQRGEVEEVKSYLSRRDDVYRPPYERGMVSHPRRVIYGGTTNKMRYLNDPSGGRRFWPVPLWGCQTKPKLIAEDRDQIWAEALDCFESGEHWWLDPAFEAEFALPEQLKRLTPWAEREGKD